MATIFSSSSIAQPAGPDKKPTIDLSTPNSSKARQNSASEERGRGSIYSGLGGKSKDKKEPQEKSWWQSFKDIWTDSGGDDNENINDPNQPKTTVSAGADYSYDDGSSIYDSDDFKVKTLPSMSSVTSEPLPPDTESAAYTARLDSAAAIRRMQIQEYLDSVEEEQAKTELDTPEFIVKAQEDWDKKYKGKNNKDGTPKGGGGKGRGLMSPPRPPDDTTPSAVSSAFDATKGEKFALSVAKKMESDHGDTPKPTKDAGEKNLSDDKKSLDVGYGHKIIRGGKEDISGKIHGIKYKNEDGTYIPLTEEQKIFILKEDLIVNTKRARKSYTMKDGTREKGWDEKLKDKGSSWDELDEDYKNVLSSLAFNVGGKKAAIQWDLVLQAAIDKDVAEFAKELRRNDANSRTEGMDNRVAKELYYAGLITSLDDLDLVWTEKVGDKNISRTSALPLVNATNSGVPQSDDEEEI